MDRVRTALYLDFDNVFSGLLKLDPDAAVAFAESPSTWLTRLSTSLTVEGPRSWLVRRCYMNPAGSVPHPDPGSESPRLYFSRYRDSFTRAGFEVIDCPSLTYRYKNAADIRMALDAMDALSDPVRYDEFVIASGDSDMAPLLVRMRAADRRTTILSPFDAAEAFTAIADRLIDGQQTLELLHYEKTPTALGVEDGTGVDPAEVLPSANPSSTDFPRDDRDATDGLSQFRMLVEQRYEAADDPLNLASLAHAVRGSLDVTPSDAKWFGLGGFVRALESLALPNMRLSQHFLWDSARHVAPSDAPASSPAEVVTASQAFALPDPVAKLARLLNLPRLPHESWEPAYDALAEYAATTTEFNLTEATKWSRDRLRAQDVEINRRALGFVTQGASYGGCPLYRKPSPTADEIAAAFVSNVLSRAEAAEISLSLAEHAAITDWLALPAASRSAE